jgi:trimeric autotransporter adhesin
MAVTLNASSTAGFVTTADTSTILQLQTNGTAALTIDASQNVGIGTTSPGAPLSFGSTADAAKIFLRGNTNEYAIGTQSNELRIASYSATTFYRLGYAGTESMRINSSGFVGIGTTSPAYALDVRGANPTVRVSRSGTAGQVVSLLFEDGNATLGAGSTTRIASDAGAMSFSTGGTSGSDSGGTERARIFSTGNVSVGSPFDLSYKMALVSTSTSSPALYLRSTASGDVGTAQLRLIKADNTNTTSQIFIQFVIDGNNVNSGQINANGASQAAFGSFSDVRLKENIVDLPLQLSNIMALRPVEFDYKDGCGHQIGFIAQEMEQVYPDAIGVGENEMLTITGWSKTEARLVKAIQELKAIVDAQGAEIAALKGATA